VQSASQAEALAHNYGLPGRVAGMLVEKPQPVAVRDIDLLWVSNIRDVKRPDRILELAGRLPEVKIHMVGGPLPGEEALFRDVKDAAATKANLRFHGRLSYRDAGQLYGRAKVLVNTSDIEGFPNSYLQAWIRGVPVVTLIDPDRVIEREGLGVAASSAEQIPRRSGIFWMTRRPGKPQATVAARSWSANTAKKKFWRPTSIRSSTSRVLSSRRRNDRVERGTPCLRCLSSSRSIRGRRPLVETAGDHHAQCGVFAALPVALRAVRIQARLSHELRDGDVDVFVEFARDVLARGTGEIGMHRTRGTRRRSCR